MVKKKNAADHWASPKIKKLIARIDWPKQLTSHDRIVYHGHKIAKKYTRIEDFLADHAFPPTSVSDWGFKRNRNSFMFWYKIWNDHKKPGVPLSLKNLGLVFCTCWGCDPCRVHKALSRKKGSAIDKHDKRDFIDDAQVLEAQVSW